MGFAFDSQVLNYAITVLWIVGVCNSVNFFDNHDGGAAGTVAVITFFLFFIAYDRQQVLVSALAIVTAGATAGFLLWNRHLNMELAPSGFYGRESEHQLRQREVPTF